MYRSQNIPLPPITDVIKNPLLLLGLRIISTIRSINEILVTDPLELPVIIIKTFAVLINLHVVFLLRGGHLIHFFI